jgi:hypothetical protein
MIELVNTNKKAIKVRSYGPTNTRGAKVKAWSSKKTSVTIPWDYCVSGSDNHIKAALKLTEKLAWHGKMVMGHCDDGDSVFVFSE